MSNLKKEAVKLLKQAGAELVRNSGPHEVWKLPTGKLVVISKTPSDWRVLGKIRTNIKRGMIL